MVWLFDRSHNNTHLEVIQYSPWGKCSDRPKELRVDKTYVFTCFEEKRSKKWWAGRVVWFGRSHDSTHLEVSAKIWRCLSIKLVFTFFELKSSKKWWAGRVVWFDRSHGISEKKSCILPFLALKTFLTHKAG